MIRINLLPTKKKRALIIPPPVIYGAGALVVLIIVTVVLTLFINKKISTVKNQIFAQEQRLKSLQSRLEEVKNYERDNEEYRKKTQIIEQLKKNQIVPLRLLDEVSEKLPKGVWLSELVDSGGLISINGYAHTNYDLVTYVQNLKGSKYIEDVTLVESRQKDMESFSVYKFKLTFKMKV
jgi:type IV pilus assembly protein PilN